MKMMIILSLFFIFHTPLATWGSIDPFGLPKLNTIKTAKFVAPYSSPKGGSYEKSALFFSQYTKQRNTPDLIYNGSDRNSLYFQAGTGSDDFALISDLGTVTLQQVTARKSFNWESMAGKGNTFKNEVPLFKGHTYIVLESKEDVRALYAITINDIGTDLSAKVSYKILSYSAQQSLGKSPGFELDNKAPKR
jgi:hypothetical protein